MSSEAPMIIYGIDPSLTATAVCVFYHPDPQHGIQALHSEPSGEGVAGRIERYEDLVRRVMQDIDEEGHVFIEGYSFGSPFKATPVAEYGGLLRQSLLRNCASVIEVPPTVVKKFATGKGVGDKGQVQAHVAKRWGVIFPSNDETDAYVLARIGLCYHGLAECETEWQKDVIEKMKNPPAKKIRKRRVANAD